MDFNLHQEEHEAERTPIHFSLSWENEPGMIPTGCVAANELLLQPEHNSKESTAGKTPSNPQSVSKYYGITRSQLKDTAVLMGLSYTDTLIRINHERQLQGKPPLTLVEDDSITSEKTSYRPQQQNPEKKAPFTMTLSQMVTIAVMLVFFLAILFGIGDTSNEPVIQPQETLAELSLPQNGHFFRELSLSDWLDGDGEMSEITVTASSSENVVVAPKDVEGNERISFFVRAGKTATVYVPPETLYAYFASGDSWYGYGKGKMFGKYTSYSMDDEAIDFSRYTMEYTLYPVTNGNFSETPISADEFF